MYSLSSEIFNWFIFIVTNTSGKSEANRKEGKELYLKNITTMGLILVVEMLKADRARITELFFYLETET